MNKKGKSTLEKMELKLRFERYAESTIKTYLGYAEMFLSHFSQDIYHIPIKDVSHFLENFNYTSTSQQNQIISSVRYLFENIAKSKLRTLKVKRPRKSKKLARIIDAELLVEKIRAIENLKHKAILTLGLSCGLRVSEVINLKWEHLDRRRNILNVIQGKGSKDRCCILNDTTIELLENYWRQYKSVDFVFNGQSNPRYSTTSIQKIVKKYIDPKESYHCLRHSYCTYAIDNGTELKQLSISMGHNSTRTIEKTYYHQSSRTLKTIKQAI